ncbi:hypothetical protein F5B19DRAFT_462644 [Rostrohypoxylon terebratum]|nr:hypothetical protein F5B19DRAFT_462644 [Rostrohypoxylon terebratum]
MKVFSQNRGPDGSRVVNPESVPQLGAGLCEIFDSQPRFNDTGKESDITPTTIQVHGRSNSTSTISGTPPDTNVTTPISYIGSSSIYQSHNVKKQLNATAFDRRYINVSNSILQYYRLSSMLSTGNALDDQSSPVSSAASPTTYPGHESSARILSSRMLQDSRFNWDITLNKIIQWFVDGKTSLSQTKELARKYQNWEFVKALDALDGTTTSDAPHTNVSQSQTPFTQITPGQFVNRSTTCTPIRSHPGMQHVYPDAAEVAHFHFRSKVATHVDVDRLFDPNNTSKLHLFVDISNIFIGFCDAVKASRGLPQTHKMQAPPFSFETLAVLMERGRSVQKRIVAGSIPAYSADNRRKYWPPYFLEAEELHYQMNIFCRVQTRKPNYSKRRGRRSPKAAFHDVNDLSTGESTGDDGFATTYEIRNGEQGVDENLHLNMMDSMWDQIETPGTMVLATGDAAEAEFSHGFLHYATRALEKGWRLELVTWKHSISSAWTDKKFCGKFSSQFRIIYLDEFLAELQVEASRISA